MARSSYVYIVTDPYMPVAAAFTVKHELMSWLEGRVQGASDEREIAEISIWRIRDGRNTTGSSVDVTSEIMGALDETRTPEGEG